MPVLASLLVTLFSGIASFFASFMAKKVAFAAAAVATFAVLTTAFFAAVAAMLSGISFVFPESDSVVMVMIWAATPPQVTAGLPVALAFDTALALYRWNVSNLNLAASV